MEILDLRYTLMFQLKLMEILDHLSINSAFQLKLIFVTKKKKAENMIL